MRVDVSRVQIKYAEQDAQGQWLSWPPGTWIYTYSALVHGRRMDCQVAALAEKTEQWVRERNDGPILEALARAWKRRQG